MKTLADVDQKIKDRKAKVYTAMEFKRLAENEGTISEDDVDVVTCGTFGVMSGTMAVMTVPVADPGVFKKADSITLNGVPGNVGPCPNESLGIVDCTVNGTARRDHDYCGGHLFRDLVRGDNIEVVVFSEGVEYRRTVTLKDLPTAKIVLIRGAFRNYTGFVNPSKNNVKTIFSGPHGLQGDFAAASVSGCGEINPIQNDPDLRFLKSGYPVMINGSCGIIMGTGTRSTSKKPNLFACADMKGMDHTMMGGFITSEGAECLTSVGVVIPVIDGTSIKDLSVRDADVDLPVADVRDRIPRDSDNYGSVWNAGNTRVVFDKDLCIHCKKCSADINCPVEASPSRGILNNTKCISCGSCVSTCVGKAFFCDLGSLNYVGENVPIKIRQSSRAKAEQLCMELKKRVEIGNWNLRGD